MSLEVRTIDESEFPEWLRARRVGFLRPPMAVTGEEVADKLPHTDLSRTRAAFDRGRIVATFRSFDQRLSTVGGADLAADAVTNVTVAATHRRRGLLSRMMADDLASAKERGDACASLIAAEYPIYGRYGFGAAAWITEWEIDVTRSGFDRRWSGPTAEEGGGRVDFSDGAEIREVGPALHRALAARRAGITGRTARDWDVVTGDVHHTDPWTEPFHAVYRAASGEPEGYVTYTTEDRWNDNKQPANTASVRELVAVSPAAERALWRFVCSVDWVTRVKSGYRAPDDVLPLLLPDPRAARVLTHADMLWLRILDVPKVFEPRTYATEGALVLEVKDAAGYAGGRYLLETTPERGHCAPTTAAPELVLDVADLATLALGDESAVRLAALGRVEEAVAGAAAKTDLLLRTSPRPWSMEYF
ncbi:GNAT family N-acetyltransferase [Streptomyces roseicoloratus]|uniref:GNAT family N-acetyltransferase n=1 Tax=Streptomyces roseicoloratus TaxID=2508722 RepID=A0ABY9RXD2_9ACTN|nr:GNAT family N-acetyltransferase [Streptomyces roseicoloratus]WMX45869.1 GNAT family N-acetyltransferase [Streptomyces roseicoloratus]